MRMRIFRAADPAGGKPPAASDFARRLWASSREADRVQHIRVRAGNAWLDIAVLLMSADDNKARAVGARICAAALAADPVTVGWTLQSLD